MRPGRWQDLACINSQRKRAPSRHDRPNCDRAGGRALDPTTATRVLLVTAVYVTAVIAAAIYPLVSPLRDASFITVEGQLVSVLNGAVWLAVLLIVFVRQPDGRLGS